MAALLISASAVADGRAEARDLFERGRTLRLQGNCADALPLFRRALEAYPAGLGSLRNIADCEEELGRFHSARRAWLEMQRALTGTHESKYDGWERDAAQAAERLAPMVATLTIELRTLHGSGNSRVAQHVGVSVNGEPLDPSLLGTPLDEDPGRYVVRAASLGGNGAEERLVDLAAGDVQWVELDVASRQPDRPRLQGSSQRTAAWIAAGLGAVSLVGAGIAGLERQSALDDLKRECGSMEPCLSASSPTEIANVHGIEDRGHAAATWVDVLVVAGAIGLSTGVALYTTAPSRSVQAGLLVSPAGISAAGSF